MNMRLLSPSLLLKVLLVLLCSSAAQARFLQTDPIGSKDDLDLYAYTAGDPVNKSDPTGNGAIIDYASPTDIRIVVPVSFTGPAATPKNIQQVQQDTANHFNGTYNVNGKKTQVTVSVEPDPVKGLPSQLNNKVTLTNGPTSLTSSQNPTLNGVSNVATSRDGSTKTEINVQSQGISQGEAAHEMGHVMGETDHYQNGVDAQGNRTSKADSGYEGNLMAQLPGTVDDKNINAILGSPKNITCGKPDGTSGC